MIKSLAVLALTLAVVPAAHAVDWSKKFGAGAFVGWSHYSVNDTAVDLRTQGLSFSYGLKPKLRLGANLGLSVAHRGGDTGGTVTGVSVAPSVSYDLVQKQGGVLYVVGRTLAYDLVKNSGNNPDEWNLDFVNAGLGIEALVSNDVGIAFEGDVMRFGVTRAARETETSVGFLAFPSVRLLARLYF